MRKGNTVFSSFLVLPQLDHQIFIPNIKNLRY